MRLLRGQTTDRSRYALELARAGAHVAVNDVYPEGETVADEIRRRGQCALWAPADVARSSEVAAMVDQMASVLGIPDVLVNNAGIETIVPMLELTKQQFDDVCLTTAIGASYPNAGLTVGTLNSRQELVLVTAKGSLVDGWRLPRRGVPLR